MGSRTDEPSGVIAASIRLRASRHSSSAAFWDNKTVASDFKDNVKEFATVVPGPDCFDDAPLAVKSSIGLTLDREGD